MDHGQTTQLRQNTTEITSLTAGATHTWTGGIPAGATVIGVTVYVTEAIVGPTSFKLGDGTTADKFGAGILVALGSTGGPTTLPAVTAMSTYPAVTNIVLTAVGGTFTGGSGKGKIRLTVHYISITNPAS
jgi:hypothetical protein